MTWRFIGSLLLCDIVQTDVRVVGTVTTVYSYHYKQLVSTLGFNMIVCIYLLIDNVPNHQHDLLCTWRACEFCFTSTIFKIY